MPATTTGWLLGASFTGMGLSMLGSLQAGEDAKAQAESQAEWDEYNAKLAEREGLEKQEAAAEEERRGRRKEAAAQARNGLYQGAPLVAYQA